MAQWGVSFITVSWDGEPKHKEALPEGAHAETLLFIFKNSGKAQ